MSQKYLAISHRDGSGVISAPRAIRKCDATALLDNCFVLRRHVLLNLLLRTQHSPDLLCRNFFGCEFGKCNKYTPQNSCLISQSGEIKLLSLSFGDVRSVLSAQCFHCTHHLHDPPKASLKIPTLYCSSIGVWNKSMASCAPQIPVSSFQFTTN